MKEKEEAKAEKEKRKQEKNRKKRHAYREKQRFKQFGGRRKDGVGGGADWTKKGEKRKKDRTTGAKNKEERRKKKQKKKACKEGARADETELFDEARWEKSMSKALNAKDFDKLQRLFEASILYEARKAKTGVSDNMRSFAVKRYRVLSTRYHPDKHASASKDPSMYKVAFQALNEARLEVLGQLPNQ